MLQRFRATWSPLVSTGLMASGLMGYLSYLEREGKCWCGMPPARTHWLPHTALRGWSCCRGGEKEERQVCPPGRSHHFVPVAVEILAVFGSEARSFLQELAWPLYYGLHTGATPTPLAKENCCGSPTGKHSCHSGVLQGYLHGVPFTYCLILFLTMCCKLSAQHCFSYNLCWYSMYIRL